MKLKNSSIICSPSDLVNHISCKHLTSLNKKAALGELKRPVYSNRVLDMLREKGISFEEAYLQELEDKGNSIVKISQEDTNAEAATVEAMRDGVDVIYQARLKDGSTWAGWADFLIKVNKSSGLGNWSYEVLDTKLAAETRAGAILQIALYTEAAAQIQGVLPEFMRIKNPNEEISYRVNDYIAYVRFAKRGLEAALQNDPETYPEPTAHCDICNWWELCNQKRREDDHLGFVAGMGTSQIKEVRTHRVKTLKQMAELPLPLPFTPSKGLSATYVKLREQARVQFESREDDYRPIVEILELEAGRGFYNLPEPTSKDIYLDLEGDPMVDPNGLEYLFGWVCEGKYYPVWVTTEAEEKATFEAFMNFALDRKNEEPGIHIYHYAPYEVTAFKRLMGKYATQENEIDNFLRGHVFVDLYGIVRQAIRASVEKYSIKDLEKFYGYTREMDLRKLSKYKGEFEYLLQTQQVKDASQEMRDAIQLYNQDDCISTEHLHHWLEKLRIDMKEKGCEISRPIPAAEEASERITEHQERIKPIYDTLMADIPVSAAERTAEEQGKYILANMLDWYRREDKSFWWEKFRILDLSTEELLEEKCALAYLTYTGECVAEKKSFIQTYSFPEQECDLSNGKSLQNMEGKGMGTIVSIDFKKRLVKIKKGESIVNQHPEAVFSHIYISPKKKEEAIIALAEWVAAYGLTSKKHEFSAVRDLLLRNSPKTTEPIHPSRNKLELALDWSLKLNRSFLPIQGPPGAGKSYTASNMIVGLIQAGKKIGITALSHKVINNLLEKVQDAAEKEKISIQMIQKVASDFEGELPWGIAKNEKDIVKKLGTCQVIAGTSFMWCSTELMQSVDYLFVDEAGQLALIDTLAIGNAAQNLVLLGDPQQLQQPQQGVHPEGTEVSALEHILQDQKTIADEKGIFLDKTWRMHPSICDLDSELFYESKLHTIQGLENQGIVSKGSQKMAGLFVKEVDHQNNVNTAIEEVKAVEAIIDELTNGEVHWVDKENSSRVITRDDIKIISPYNAQVNLLAANIPGVAIGTVDKFQGQEAPVVIYSVATSSPQDAPRGMEFLYSPNRFNVAISRARSIFILVANQAIFEPECKSPAQIKLANSFCRYIEVAKSWEENKKLIATTSVTS